MIFALIILQGCFNLYIIWFMSYFTQIMVDLTIEFQIRLWSVSAMPYSVNYEALG